MKSDIYTLFEVETKKELKKAASSLIITFNDIETLISLSNQKRYEFPYKHACKLFEEVPQDLILTEKNIAALRNNGAGKLNRNAKKTINKLFQMPKQIKRSTAHIFFNPTLQYWHMFYFDIRDRSTINNHWKNGSHLHYVSWLWPNLNPQETWLSFCKNGKKNIGNDLHIKFTRT